MEKNLKLSLVVPFFNEKESLPELLERIKRPAEQVAGQDYEIFLIDDGSTDGSMEIVRTLAAADSHLRAIRFRKNYGKSAALSRGFALARGEIVITLDADLQDDPNEIPNLVAKINEGYDLVSGWKKKRHDPLNKTLPSKLFNFATSRVSGIKLHDHNCGLKAYRRITAQSIPCYGEMHRYLPALAHWRGFRVAEIPVQHHARKYGKTKFGPSRFLKGFLDLLTIAFLNRYTRRPLHLFGLVGILLFLVGLGINGYFLAQWIIEREMHIRPLILLALGAMLMGIQIVSLGLLGEMIAYTGQKEEYLVAEEINL